MSDAIPIAYVLSCQRGIIIILLFNMRRKRVGRSYEKSIILILGKRGWRARYPTVQLGVA